MSNAIIPLGLGIAGPFSEAPTLRLAAPTDAAAAKTLRACSMFRSEPVPPNDIAGAAERDVPRAHHNDFGDAAFRDAEAARNGMQTAAEIWRELIADLPGQVRWTPRPLIADDGLAYLVAQESGKIWIRRP